MTYLDNPYLLAVLALFTFSLLGYIFLFLAFMFSWYLSLANLARGIL